MFEIDECTTTKEMLRSLMGCAKVQVQAVCVLINNMAGYDVPVYGTKEQLIFGLRGVDQQVLRDAITDLISQDENEDDDESYFDDEDDDEQED